MDFELELGSVQKTLFVYNIHALIIYTKKFLHSDWSNFFSRSYAIVVQDKFGGIRDGI